MSLNSWTNLSLGLMLVAMGTAVYFSQQNFTRCENLCKARGYSMESLDTNTKQCKCDTSIVTIDMK